MFIPSIPPPANRRYILQIFLVDKFFHDLEGSLWRTGVKRLTELFRGQHIRSMTNLAWFVAHTRPRREKKLQQFCEQKGFPVTLPCYRSVRKYRGKKVVFQKPLFPGYVFMQLLAEQRQSMLQSDLVANLLVVHDQAKFAEQLGEILQALELDLEIHLAPEIGVGTRVKVKSGPLRGMEGWVEQRYGMTTVLLRLDFIGQAAAIKLPADELEPT